jgi:hypothetical protein
MCLFVLMHVPAALIFRRTQTPVSGFREKKNGAHVQRVKHSMLHGRKQQAGPAFYA